MVSDLVDTQRVDGPKEPPLVFGLRKEWVDFDKRNPLFRERFPTLERMLNAVFARTFTTKTLAEQVAFHLSRACAEDFMEIMLLAGNGYGIGARKLLRGMYERAVTARFIAMHPERAQDFIDFGQINMYKLLEPIRRTHGKQLIPDQIVSDLSAFHAGFRDRPIEGKGRLAVIARLWRRLRRTKRKRSTSRWSGDLSFEAMAQQVGSLGRMIVYGWYLPTFEEHASVNGIISRTEVTDQSIVFDGGPQREVADEQLTWAHHILLDVLELQVQLFKLTDLTDLLGQCGHDLQDIWQGHCSAPPPSAGVQS